MNVPSDYTEREFDKYSDSPSEADIELLQENYMTDIKLTEIELERNDLAIAGISPKPVEIEEEDFLAGSHCGVDAYSECESCQ